MPAKVGTKVRTFTKQTAAPEIALNLIATYLKFCKERGLSHASFSVDKLPKSVNHMYIHTRFNTRLEEWVKEFRLEVRNSIVRGKINWKPIGITAAVILLRSPVWVTAESRVRKIDSDNKIKPILDAIQAATGQPDENFWHTLVFKVAGKREQLTVWLFDLGDIVDYHY